MLSLTYTSRATTVFGPDEIGALLRHSREKNTRRGLTGMLLFVEGRFMQVLEGEDAEVWELYTEIAADPRHDEIKMLLDDAIPERRFAQWSMGFPIAAGDVLADVPGYSDVLVADRGRRSSWEDPSRAQLLLDWFRRSAPSPSLSPRGE